MERLSSKRKALSASKVSNEFPGASAIGVVPNPNFGNQGVVVVVVVVDSTLPLNNTREDDEEGRRKGGEKLGRNRGLGCVRAAFYIGEKMERKGVTSREPTRAGLALVNNILLVKEESA